MQDTEKERLPRRSRETVDVLLSWNCGDGGPFGRTEVGIKSPGRQDSCPKISDNSLEGCPKNVLENASKLHLFQFNMGLIFASRPKNVFKIPSTRSQEKL